VNHQSGNTKSPSAFFGSLLISSTSQFDRLWADSWGTTQRRTPQRGAGPRRTRPHRHISVGTVPAPGLGIRWLPHLRRAESLRCSRCASPFG
jgi:hypothetical protein